MICFQLLQIYGHKLCKYFCRMHARAGGRLEQRGISGGISVSVLLPHLSPSGPTQNLWLLRRYADIKKNN